ncbi:MAG: pseudouridine synthase [Proteobacteria bacterium]|nr:pseudouridine synthase [Pseudomonadota bacterium]
MNERIQKYLSHAGISSRREAEKLIQEGRVAVNGKRVETLGMKIDPEKDKVKVDNKLVSLTRKIYILLHKPKQYITSLHDPQGRPVIMDLLPELGTKVFPVGRLDYDAEGLILLTNDGDLAQKLQHPKYRIPRTYLVKVKGIPDPKDLTPLTKGIKLEDGFTLPATVKKMKDGKNNSWIEITVREGRNRLIKRMFAKIGFPVLKLIRTEFAGLKVRGLPLGHFCFLNHSEVTRLISISLYPQISHQSKKVEPTSYI